MIRLSDVNDTESIINLWNEAFGDSEEDIKFFLKHKYKPENTVVYEDSGKIVSVLFLLDGSMHLYGKDYSSYYLYAACTAKSHRGKGLMAQMLAYSKNLSQSRGVNFICLKPGEASLFDFYSKHGYKTSFYRKKLTVSKNDITVSSCFITENSVSDYSALRNKAYSDYNYFRWDNSAVEFAAEHNKYFGGNAFINCNGYILYTVNNDKIYVKECTLTSNFIETLTLYLINKHGVSSVIYNLPVNYPSDIGNFVIEPDSMIISTYSSSIDFSDGYLGLTLE